MVHLHPARTLTISIYVYVDSLSAVRRLSLLHTVVSGRTQGRSARILLLFGYEATLFKASSESGVVQFDEPMQATPKRIEGKIVDWELLEFFLRPPFHIPTTPPVLSSLKPILAQHK